MRLCCCGLSKQRSGNAVGATTAPRKPLEEWRLRDYIDVAAELNVIKSDTAKQARLAKDFAISFTPADQ